MKDIISDLNKLLIILLLNMNKTNSNYQCLTLKEIEGKPIIGVVTNEYPENDDESKISFVTEDYYQWLKELGAHVIFIEFYSDYSHFDYIIPKINGLLLQGGERNLISNGKYEKSCVYMIEICNKFKIPVWFSCQGFQFLFCHLTQNYACLRNLKTSHVLLPNFLLPNESKLLSHFTEEDVKICSENQSFVHYHNWGVTDQIFEDYPILKDELKIVARSKDLEGVEFVSMVESKDFSKHKYFSVQSHPEKAKYSTCKDDNTPITGQMNYLIGLGFIDEAKKNIDISSDKITEEDLNKWSLRDEFTYLRRTINNNFMFKDSVNLKEFIFEEN